MFRALADWILLRFVPSLPSRQRGHKMRIHPIRDFQEPLFFPLREEFKETGCRPCWVRVPCCEPFSCNPERRSRRCGEHNINQILLRRAMAGVLTRLRSFDWQVIHGHNVGDSGHSLDTFA
jgi:hypothetical protein